MEELIVKHNPWWSGLEDIVIERWRDLKIKWIPEWINQVSFKPFSLNIVMGPRQVGKTTGIKLLIQRLLKNRKPESIFFFNCDFLTDIGSLKEILDTYMKFKESKGIRNSYIFLDEITSVPRWWRIIKGYIDLGLFNGDVLTVSGSSSIMLRGEAELFPGRRGFGQNIIVMPLTYREFLKIHGVKIEYTGNMDKDISRNLAISKDIKEYFPKYLDLGGFPLSINNYPMAEEQLLAGFESEILKAGKNLQIVKEIVSSIFRKAPSPISYLTIGRDIGISYKTVQDYIELLRNLFMLDIAYLKEGKRIIWRREKKFYFLDPFISKTLSHWSLQEYLESALYEWVVESHLQRKFGHIFYYRNSYEIDCIVNNLKIEVKAGKPHRKYPRNVIILDEEKIPIFLATIV